MSPIPTDPAAQTLGRLATFSMGGALGSALASPIMQAVGWHGVAAPALLFPRAALAYFLACEPRRAA